MIQEAQMPPNLHTVVSLPAGVFLPYSGVKTNVLFFDCAGKTIVNANNIKEYDISAKNPNRNEAINHKSPLELVEKIKENNGEIAVLLDEIEGILTL